MKLGMISLGCAKNLVDSELFLGVARKYNIEIVNQVKDADVIVVNTCGFIESAKKEALDTILNVLEYQKEGKKIVAMGCLVQRYLKDLMKDLPEVDYYLPISSYPKLDAFFFSLTNEKQSYRFSYLNRVLATPRHSAYLKIGEGCNNRCSYCAIPLIRGNHVSRPFDEIIEEAETLVKRGVKEITVIAQDTTRYGTDLKDMSLAKLLKRLAQIEDLKLLRVLYLYPDEITDELIEVIKSEDKIAKYFDIPIQHASNTILKSMNRRGTKEDLLSLFEKIRNLIPSAILRTTLIVGFPGETESDFEELKEFVKRVKFERLGVFTYSDEEDTKAFNYPNKVPSEISKKRQQEIMELQQQIAFAFNTSRIGNIESVLIERMDEKSNLYLARSYREASDDVDGYIYVSGDQHLTIGTFYDVRITKSIGYDLGAILEDNKKEE